MTETITNIVQVASNYDAIVLDQWGVLHNGSAPYPHAVQALRELNSKGHRLAVLSNSGKRAEPNEERIAGIGFDRSLFETVMTSGEALWRDLSSGKIPQRCFFPIGRAPNDANQFANGLDIKFTENMLDAEAVLLMGLPDDADQQELSDMMGAALEFSLPVYCSNPDRSSPRAGGKTVISPGALAFEYKDRGGETIFYGKPHKPIFEAVQSALNVERLLMVGDSLEHDIAGGDNAGWDTLLIQGGLYVEDFASGDQTETLTRLAADKSAPHPTYMIKELQ